MEPAVLWFWPPLARAMTEFRFEGLAAAEKQADVFGYKGAQVTTRASQKPIHNNPGCTHTHRAWCLSQSSSFRFKFRCPGMNDRLCVCAVPVVHGQFRAVRRLLRR